MAEPFVFKYQMTLTELLGCRARTAAELLAGLRAVPRSSIYFHTHRFLLQHVRQSPEPPNDFAYWTANALGRHRLGEALASVALVEFARLEDVRERFASILEAHLRTDAGAPARSPEGMDFHFLSGRMFVAPAGYEARSLPEFRQALARLPVGSLYYHMFVPRFCDCRASDGFPFWFAALGHADAAAALARLDPYAMTVEGLRRKLLDILDRHA